MKIYFFIVSVYLVHQNIDRKYIENRRKFHDEKQIVNPFYYVFRLFTYSLIYNNVYLFIKKSFYLKMLSFQLNISFNKFNMSKL